MTKAVIFLFHPSLIHNQAVPESAKTPQLYFTFPYTRQQSVSTSSSGFGSSLAGAADGEEGFDNSAFPLMSLTSDHDSGTGQQNPDGAGETAPSAPAYT